MCHNKIHIGESGFGIGGVAKSDLRRMLFQVDAAGFRDGLLPLRVVVIHLDLANGKAVHMFQQHQDDAGGKGAASAGNYDGIGFHNSYTSF